MKVWIVCEGEGLPVKENERLWRMGILADYLSKHDHDVLWWTSSFDHGSKKYLVDKTTEFEKNEHEKLILLHSKIAYKKNVSISRIIYHNILASEFGKLNEKYDTPDIILCAWATQQFAKKCVQYGKRHHIPVIIDIRDPWPDYFLRVFPKGTKWLGKIVLYPMHYDAAKTLGKCDAITGVVPVYVEWGLRLAKRKTTELDRHIFLSNFKVDNQVPISEELVKWWEDKGVSDKTWNLCLIGTLSQQGDYDTLIKACINISNTNKDFRLIIAGDGDEKERLVRLSENCNQIIFAGWINKDKMNSLMRMSKCGAYSYKNSDGFKDTISNKIVQYFSAGLPVISSLDGLSKELLNKYDSGLTYEEGNPESCERAINFLISNDDKRIEMGKNSDKLFNDYFETTIVSEQFIQLFNDVIKKYSGDLR